MKSTRSLEVVHRKGPPVHLPRRRIRRLQLGVPLIRLELPRPGWLQRRPPLPLPPINWVQLADPPFRPLPESELPLGTMSRGAAGGIGEKGAMDSSWTGVFFLGGGWTWIMRRSSWDWGNGWSDGYGRTDKLSVCILCWDFFQM